MPFGRKTFLSGALVAATAALAACDRSQGAAPESSPFFRVLTAADYDYDSMMAKLRISNHHKQVFLATKTPGQSEGFLHSLRLIVKPDVSELFNHMQLAMNGYDFSLGRDNVSLTTLGVLTGTAVILGLNDEMWLKYSLGRRFNLPKTNVYYRKKSNLDPNAAPNDPNGLYQDWSAQAVLKRGGSFMVCHNAMTNLANELSDRSAEAILDELCRNLMPGFMLVPSGVTVIQLAQELGWKLYLT